MGLLVHHTMAAAASSGLGEDLGQHINLSQSTCINMNDEHVLRSCLSPELRDTEVCVRACMPASAHVCGHGA